MSNAAEDLDGAEPVGAPPLSPSAAMQLLDIGRRYYFLEQSLSAIADDLGLSRFKVARLARKARDYGIVRISIEVPENVIDLVASDQVRARWPRIVQSVVIPTPAQEGVIALREALAEAAASVVMERINADDVFGLACGRIVNETASRIRRLPGCTIVQLTGVTSHGPIGDSSIRTMQRIAVLSRGRSFPIYAPAVLENADVVAALRREPGVGAAVSRFPTLTAVLVTVGAWREGESTLYAACPPDLRERVRREGAVAEFMGHLFDAEGDVVGTDFTERCLVAPLEFIRAARTVVLVAGGEGRVNAIRAVLDAGLVTHLITDSRTAAELVRA